MIKYETKDGELIEANSPLAVVEALRAGSLFDSEKGLEVFLRDMSHRIQMYDGSLVRGDSAMGFVEDLLACGWLRVVE